MALLADAAPPVLLPPVPDFPADDARFHYTVHSRLGVFIGHVRAACGLDALRALHARAFREADLPAPCETGEVLQADRDCLTLFFLLRPGQDPIYYQFRDFRVEQVIP